MRGSNKPKLGSMAVSHLTRLNGANEKATQDLSPVPPNVNAFY